MTDNYVSMRLMTPFPQDREYPHQTVYMTFKASLNFMQVTMGKKLFTIGLN